MWEERTGKKDNVQTGKEGEELEKKEAQVHVVYKF